MPTNLTLDSALQALGLSRNDIQNGQVTSSESDARSVITKAYRFLALQYHPDKNKDHDATDMFKKIAEAYQAFDDQSSLVCCDFKRIFNSSVPVENSSQHSAKFFSFILSDSMKNALYHLIETLHSRNPNYPDASKAKPDQGCEMIYHMLCL